MFVWAESAGYKGLPAAQIKGGTGCGDNTPGRALGSAISGTCCMRPTLKPKGNFA